MRGEPDFEAYVAGRGTSLVRGLLGLGLDHVEAEGVAVAAFAALRPRWQDVVGADPDVVLWQEALAIESRRRRVRGDDLPGLDRVAVALRGPGGLAELQVCEVLGLTVSRVRALLADGFPADDPDVVAFPVVYARVRSVAAATRRRRWGWTTAVVALGLLATAVAVGLTRPDPAPRPGDALPPVRAHAEDNPAEVVWWADGTLHLSRAALRVPDVRRLVATGDGAAYVDGERRLVAVRADGHRTLLGHLAARSALVSSPALGLVAWVDDSVAGSSRLVVWDVTSRRRIASVVTAEGVRPITFDGGWLRFGQGLADWAWDPSGGPAQETGDGYAANPSRRTALVDAVAGTRLEQLGYYLRVVRNGRRGETLIQGFGGSLSADGRLVLTGPDGERGPRLYDARTGLRVDPYGQASPLAEGHIRAATFTSGERIAWLADLDGRAVLVACGSSGSAASIGSTGTGPGLQCSAPVDLGSPDLVLIAQDSAR